MATLKTHSQLVAASAAKSHAVADKLSFVVKSKSIKYWFFRYTLNGKTKKIKLGKFPEVSMREAKDMAFELRRALEQGIDPKAQRETEQRESELAAIKKAEQEKKNITFKKAFAIYLFHRSKAWKKDPLEGTKLFKAQTKGRFVKHVFPILGDRKINDITTQDLLGLYHRVYKKTPRTGELLGPEIEKVFDGARNKGYFPSDKRNPARWKNGLALEFHKASFYKKSKCYRGLHHNAAAEVFARLSEPLPSAYATATGNHAWYSGAKARVRLAIQWTLLTVARGGETRLARWRDIQVEEDSQLPIWVKPVDNIKTGRFKSYDGHAVPLTKEMLKILDQIPRGKPDEFIFHGRGSGSNPMGKETMTAAIKRDFAEFNFTTHGMRSAFRTWAHEILKLSLRHHDVIKMCQSHSTGDDLEMRYMRGDLLIHRHKVMQEWERWVVPANPAKVIEPPEFSRESSCRSQSRANQHTA